MMTKEEKIKLKKMFPKKWVTILAKRSGYSKVYVRKVMDGSCDSYEIEKEALLLAEEFKNDLNITMDLKQGLLQFKFEKN